MSLFVCKHSLFEYYKGSNRQHAKINMTAPVLVDIENSTYTVYFYLPKLYQSGVPPQASLADIVEVKLPKNKYAAVRRYGGFVDEKNIAEEVASLKKGLQGTPYQEAAKVDGVTVAGYNSPFELTNRVNEVFLWFD